MARDFTNSNTVYLSGTKPITGTPFTMACWFNADAASANDALMNIGVAGSSKDYWELRIAGGVAGDPLKARAHRNTGGAATTSTGITVGTWHHGCAVFTSATSRACYIDGGSKGTNGANATPAGTNGIKIGRASATARAYDGKIAEAVIWNIALSDAEVALAASGVSPLLVRPDALLAYYPLIGRYSPEIDLIGGLDLTVNGSVLTFVHPRIFYPSLPHIITAPAAASGPQSIAATGIAVTVDIGVPTLVFDQSISATGIAVTADIGTASISATVSLAATGIPVTVDIGSATVSPGVASISATGLPVSVDIGAATVSPGAVNLAALGIPVGIDFGAATIAQTTNIVATGIPVSTDIGTASIAQPILSSESYISVSRVRRF